MLRRMLDSGIGLALVAAVKGMLALLLSDERHAYSA